MMRTTLNLSARPFVNHRLLYIAVAAIVLISLWLYLWTSSQRSLVTARADSLAVRAWPQWQTVYRNASSSWRSWPFPLAPMRRRCGSPSLKRISVGIDITS